MGIPSIALLLDFFKVKESAEGFLYISKCFRGYRAFLMLPWLCGLQEFVPVLVLKMKR